MGGVNGPDLVGGLSRVTTPGEIGPRPSAAFPAVDPARDLPTAVALIRRVAAELHPYDAVVLGMAADVLEATTSGNGRGQGLADDAQAEGAGETAGIALGERTFCTVRIWPSWASTSRACASLVVDGRCVTYGHATGSGPGGDG